MSEVDRDDPEREASLRLEALLPEAPVALVVLGSGLGPVADALTAPRVLGFEAIPGFPPATVAGHSGRFVAGLLEGHPVLIQSGRLHGYEGHSPRLIGMPVRLAARVGARAVVLTNSAGGLSRTHPPGTLAVLTDHLDLQTWGGGAPGTGSARTFDPALARIALSVSSGLGLRLSPATYAGVLGPSYETPAEVDMLRRLGADVVGMSTVQELRAALAAGLPALGLSVVTNFAVGLGRGALQHEDVIESGARGARDLIRLLPGVVDALARAIPRGPS